MSKELSVIVIGPRNKEDHIFKAKFKLGHFWKYTENKKAKADFRKTVKNVLLLVERPNIHTGPQRKDGHWEIQLQPGKLLFSGEPMSKELQAVVGLFENLKSESRLQTYIGVFNILSESQREEMLGAVNLLWENSTKKEAV